MSKLHLITICFFALSLGGCASLSKQSSVDTQIEQADATIPNAWLLPLNSDFSNPADWARIYNDPLLLSYIQMAARQNYDIRLARTRVDAAEAAVRRARAGLWPLVGASLSASGLMQIGDTDTNDDSYGAGLSASWDPDLFGVNKAVVRGAKADQAVQVALAEDTKQRILALTARSYIIAVEADMQVELAQVNLDFQTEQRRIAEARFRAGDTSKADYSFAEANYQSALSSYESTRQGARAARRALSLILGDYPLEALDLADNLGPPLNLPPRTVPAQVLERRPDIVAARANVASRLASLRAVEGADWPSAAITGGLSAGSEFEILFDPGEYIASIGASLAANVFDGGFNKASRDAAQASLDGALLTYEQSLRAAMGEISDAYDRAETLKRSLAYLQASSLAANEALRLETIQYDLGESSLLDLLQVQTRVNTIDISLVRTQAALLENTILAFEAIGGFGGPF